MGCALSRHRPGGAVLRNGRLHPKSFHARLSSCKIVSMQDCFHAGFHATYVMRVVADGVTARIDGEMVAETDTESKR